MARFLAPFAVALALVAAAPAPSPAAPYTDSFGALIADLETRRDNDFGGTLDKTAKKQQAAVLKSLAALAKEADDAGDDFNTAAVVAGLLEKAYASEFAPAALPSILDGALDALLDVLQEENLRIASHASAVSSKLNPAVTALYTDINPVSGNFPTNTLRAKAMAAYWKKLAKIEKSIEKEFGKGDLILWSNGTVYRRTGTAMAEWYTGDNTLQIYGVLTNPVNGQQSILYFLVGGITGPGEYPLSGAMIEGSYRVGVPPTFSQYDLDSGSGTLVVTTADVAGKHFAGSLQCTLTRIGGTTTSIPELRFDIEDEVTIIPGNGF